MAARLERHRLVGGRRGRGMEGKQTSATKGCALAGSGEEDILSGLYCEG